MFITLILICLFTLYYTFDYSRENYRIPVRNNLSCVNANTNNTFSIKEYEDPKNLMSKETKEKYYKLFNDIHTLLKENGINYTLIAGSLLGAYRHQDIIPFDDDGDIIVLPKDFKKIQYIPLESYGISFVKGQHMCWDANNYYTDFCKYKKINMNPPAQATELFGQFVRDGIHIDIFVVQPIVDNKGRKMFTLFGNNTLYSQSEIKTLFDTHECKLGKVKVNCTKKPKELLCKHFNNNLDVPNKKHSENKYTNPDLFTTSKSYFKYDESNQEIIIHNYTL